MSAAAFSASGRLRTAAAGVRWYVRELTGESAYDHYVEHAALHPDQVTLTRRDFERARQDQANATPVRQRCC